MGAIILGGEVVYGMSDMQMQMYHMGLLQSFDTLCQLIIDNPESAKRVAQEYIKARDSHDPRLDQLQCNYDDSIAYKDLCSQNDRMV